MPHMEGQAFSLVHQKRDLIRVDDNRGSKPFPVLHLTYKQAYELKTRLEDFLGDYKPGDET